MSVPLLPTRLTFPPVRAARVDRPRLLRLLQGGLAGALTLITAPAGSGKTTLVVEWLGRTGRPAAWVSLEEADNDPYSFLAYLAAALQSVVPQVAQVQPLEPTPTCLTGLIRAVLAFGDPLILVLDDLHSVRTQAVYDLLAFLIDHLPGNLHLVLISRETPPLPLARLRARGLLNEIQGRDLRFTVDEARRLFNEVMRLDLPEEGVQAFAARTEGWAAGLQLFGLSLARQESPAQQEHPLDAFDDTQPSGEGERYVMDYLAEEVLRRQPEEIQDFLLRTGVLDRFSAELCGALLAGPAADHPPSASSQPLAFQALLEDLERANLFIYPLDSARTWFRYHTLFADFLSRSLDRRAPGMARQLNRRAADWYAARGQTEEAIEYALRGRDFQRAAAWVGQEAFRFFTDGRSWAVRGWIERLPREVVLRHPRLLLFQVWEYIEHARPDLAAPLLESIEQQVASSPDLSRSGQPLEKEMAVTRLTLMVTAMRIDQANDLAREVETRLSPADGLVWSLVMIIRGVLVGNLENLDEGLRRLEDAARELQALGASYLALNALCNRGDLLCNRGLYPAAAAAYTDALDFAARQPRSWAMAGWPSYLLGSILYEWNDLQAAAPRLERGLELCALTENARMLASARVALARLYWARGETERVAALLQQALEASQVPGVDEAYRREIELARLRLLWLCGEREPYRRWAEAYAAGRAAEHAALNVEEELALARWQIWSGDPTGVPDLLDGLRPHFRHSLWNQVLLDWLSALACERLGQAAATPPADPLLAQAAALAQSAVEQAAPQGYIRLFLDDAAAVGPTAGALLARVCLSAAAPGPYLEKLRTALGRSSGPPGLLSPREIEILGLVAQGLTNAQIAARLVIAPGTVKKHLDNIFLKLDARTRLQALAVAKEKNLL